MPISKIKGNAINDGAITLAKTDNLFENTTFTGDDGIVVPKGTDAERPVTPVVGHFRFNEDSNAMEQYTSDGWVAIASPPIINQSDIVSIDATGSTTLDLTITGSFFQNGAVISFIDTNGTSQNADTTTFTNSSEVVATVTRANFSNANEPYDLKVTNPSGLSYTIEEYIRVDAAPAFTTAPGSLGSIELGEGASELTTSTIVATDAEGETVTFTVNSGSLPTGMTLGSNGVISGTTTEGTTGATSSFVVRADDGTGNTTDATFTITTTATVFSYSLSNAWDTGSWNVTGAGVVAAVSGAWNNNISNHASWDGDTGNNTTASSIAGISSEFARHITMYRGSDVKVSGAAVWSGHTNTNDPLPVKDVAFYYSTDTTNGTDGTWTRITPKAFFAASATKASAATNYVGQRLSQVSSDHVVLSGNVLQDGTRVGSTSGYSYNYYGDQHDTIVWDEVTCRGLRIDVRTKWGNGYYSNEKPHMAMVKLLKGTNNNNVYRTRVYTKIDNIEDLTDTQFYIDPATTANGGSWDGTTLQDLSANNFDFTPSVNYANYAPTISSTAGGTMEFSNGAGSLRKTATWSTSDSPDADSKHSAFTIGCWVKFSGNNSNQGVMFYGTAEPNSNRRHYFRTAFNSSAYHLTCGDSMNETDYWMDVIAPDGASNSSQTYISNNSTKWHLFLSACDDQGNRLVSWNGGRWMTNWYNGKGYALNSGSNYPVGFGGDPHNDNYATHSFGPMFYYKNVLPYEYILKEWNRNKTRFGW
jgi:hypothetical protein